MRIDGCIFDLDGTLLDSMPVWRNVGFDYLIKNGYNPDENLRKLFRTMGLGDAAAYMVKQFEIDKSPVTVSDEIASLMEDYYQNCSTPKPYVIEFLDILYKKGIKMCIATATDRYLVEKALKHNDMQKYFMEIFTCKGVGSSKQEPVIYNQALKCIGTLKEHTFVFEDALYAAKTAVAAGYNVVGIYDEASADHEEDLKALCDLYIHSFKEMIDRVR